MPANYPGSQPALKTNFADNSPKTEELLAKGLNQPNLEINAVAGELGTNPKSAALEAPSSSATAVVNLLGQLKQAFKNIKGTANWYTSAAASLATIWGKFHASTGHTHSAGSNDAPKITAGGLATDAVETAKIKANAVTGAKITATDGLLRTRTIYTANNTWTKPAGLKFVIVRVQGGGGGGGGIGSTNGTAASGGGGQGEHSESKIAVGTLGATEVVTIGAGGAAGANTGTNGGVGGTASLGSLITAIGGGGGLGSNGVLKMREGGIGGTGGVGDFKLAGGVGGNANDNGTSFIGGHGGGFGGGRAPTLGNGVNSSANTGGGGSGAVTTGTTVRIGGIGGSGYIIVDEYF